MTITLDKLNPNLLKTISIRAKKENKTENKVLEDLIEEGLKNKESQIPDYFIGNKDTYNPNHERLMSNAGIAKHGKPFNAVKLVREMRDGGHDIP